MRGLLDRLYCYLGAPRWEHRDVTAGTTSDVPLLITVCRACGTEKGSHH